MTSSPKHCQNKAEEKEEKVRANDACQRQQQSLCAGVIMAKAYRPFKALIHFT